MGKNRNIKIISKLLAGMIAHKILEKYTNIKLSLNHLRMEVDNYRENALSYINEFHWNEDEKKVIKKEALRKIDNELKKPHFNDVKFPAEEKENILDEIMSEVFG